MKRLQACFGILLSCGIAVTPPADARNPLDVSTEPLGTSTGVTIKPNLWYILDNSGSMDWTFTPDWVKEDVSGAGDSMCQRNVVPIDATGKTSGNVYTCGIGDPPYMAAGFNKSYYNPAITYNPPINAAGASMGNASPTAAKGEPFRYPNASSALGTCFGSSVSGGNGTCDLTTKFPHKWFCKAAHADGSAPDANCLENPTGSSYVYPDATYLYNDTATSNGAPYYYVMSGEPIWCSSPDLDMSTCTSSKWTSSTFRYPRFTSNPTPVNGTASTLSVTITKAQASGSVTKITAGTTTIFNGNIAVSGSNTQVNRNNLAVQIVANIGGGFTATQTTSCNSGSSSSCNPVIKITAPWSATGTSNTTYNGKSLTITRTNNSNITYSTTGSFSGGKNYSSSFAGVAFTRVDILPSVTSYTKAATRTDCTGATCTYQQELQNFANWYSYYRSRMLMMKSAIATAFSSVSDTAPGVGFRVGFSTINSTASYEVPIADFNQTQKDSVYGKLFTVSPSGSTPLRAALSRAGRVFTGSIYTGASDPVQYSCQQNFAFLSTDGYWNTDVAGSDFPSVGDVDGSAVVPYKDALGKSNTLADVARYFYVNDLRPDMTDDVPKASGDETLTGNSMMHQHMKTFTMGLGIDGNLAYSPAYLSGGSADYQAIQSGTSNWGDPIGDTGASRIDDLWHAAVDGHGQYFSASDPTEVADGLAKTLGAAAQETGSSAAAATSNLEPVAGDNYAYVASYTTVVWDGNLQAKYIDLSTGGISDADSASIWSARDQLDNKAALGTRLLVTGTGASGQRLLTWGNLTGTEKAYFEPTQISACNPITLCPGATGENLFNFLMGGADTTNNGSYRTRSHVLGDIVSSQPVYVKDARFSYYDAGYDAYKSSTEARAGMVYVGANDGFLHAFSADTGAEVWAYAPTPVLTKLYKLADPSYTHNYYVDGPLTVGDIFSGSWRTMLVGGMNGGGRYYFGIDVSSASTPSVRWEFTDSNMGYTYGNPVLTKLANGTWVALVTSGYNNGTTVGGDGKGYLYVLDAFTGGLLFKLSTGSGSAGSPSGLGKIANWVDDPTGNNTTRYVYGGDLNGDFWRFDLEAQTVMRLMAVGMPITTRPELAEVNYKRTIFFGTGLFLETAQRDPAANVGNAIYGVRDDDESASISAGGLVSVPTSAIQAGGGGITEAEWSANKGWTIALPSGYFMNVDPKIQLSTLAVVTNHVAAAAGDAGTSCTAAKGDHLIYFIDFATGGGVKDSSHPSVVAGTSLAVGINIIRLPDGKMKIITTTADNKHITSDVAASAGASKARRISWRELTTN